MSAIKLPATAHPSEIVPHHHDWEVQAEDGIRVATRITEEEAKQIALALNLHDDLVAGVSSSRDALDQISRLSNINTETRKIIIAVGNSLNSALARAK